MKATLLALATILCLAGCHATKNKDASSADHAANSTPATDKVSEKSRDAMMGKSMNVQSEHWASSPAVAATAATPASTPGPSAPASAASPATAPAAAKGSGH